MTVYYKKIDGSGYYITGPGDPVTTYHITPFGQSILKECGIKPAVKGTTPLDENKIPHELFTDLQDFKEIYTGALIFKNNCKPKTVSMFSKYRDFIRASQHVNWLTDFNKRFISQVKDG